MTYSDAIRRRLKQLYQQQNMTANKLATWSGVSWSTMKSIMNGRTKNPGLSTLHHLAFGLGMTVSELLDFQEMNEYDLIVKEGEDEE